MVSQTISNCCHSNQISTFSAEAGDKNHQKMDGIFTQSAFGAQLDQLNKIGIEHPEIANPKKASLMEHLKTVSAFDKFALASKLQFKKINIIRTLLLRLQLHPATFTHTYEKMKDRYPLNSYSNSYSSAERISLYTQDHQQIDAMIFRGGNPNEKRAVFMMTAGNAWSYENWMSQADIISRENKVDVVLFNPRGIGLSLGTEYCTDDAVEDCKTVIKYALENLCKDKDPKQLGVFGLSLGGGISATALKELQDEKIVNEIGLYINCESFPSIPECAEGMLGIPASISRIAMGILGINPLNAGDALTEKKLANKTAVITAKEDDWMVGKGRLANHLECKKSEFDTNSPVHKIEFIIEEGVEHGVYHLKTIQDIITRSFGTA